MQRRAIQRFQLLELLGEGGMGAVYRAHDPQLERDVAIKLLRGNERARSELSPTATLDLRDKRHDKRRAGLLEEARMMARVTHPNVVPIYELGLDGDDVFVVMEYVPGCTLRAWLEGERTVAERLHIFAQVARGLAAAHDAGVVHRDLKPDNVLIGGDGRARVTDFGIAVLAAPTAIVRTARLAGTPRYMAPELLQGRAATPASDVYAFAIALSAAFIADPLPEPLRALVGAALSAVPAERPPIGRLLAALELPTPRRRWRPAAVVAVVATIAVASGAALALGRSDDAPSCTSDPRLLAGRWDPDKRAAIAARVVGGGGAQRLVALFERRAGEVAGVERAVCEAAHRRELTDVQVRQRRACIERRAIELGAVVEAALVANREPETAEQRLNRAPAPASCAELAVPPPAAPVGTIAALYRRFVRSPDITPQPAAIAELTAIEREARALGDGELAARAAVNLGMRLRNTDQLAASDETLQRAYREALRVASTDTAASALIERSWTMANAADMAAAKSIGELALDLATKPGTTVRTRMRVYRTLGRGELVRSEYRAAIATLGKGLALADAADEHNTDVELLLRIDLADALILVGDRADQAIAFARETVAFAREHAGERAPNYPVALDLLAKAYRMNGRVGDALPHLRRAVEILGALYPPTHSQVIQARGELGAALRQHGDLDAAYTELAHAVDSARTNEQMRRNYPWLVCQLARAQRDLGRPDDALRSFEQALELLASTHGADHVQTLAQRHAYTALLVDAGHLDQAERVLASLEAAYLRKPEPADKRPALLHGGVAVDLALARGRWRDAEALARRALAELSELAADRDDLAPVQRRLGTSLVEQGRFAEAAPIFETALAAVTTLRADDRALYEVALARAELGLGRRSAALARAARARTLIEHFPGATAVRAQLAKLR